MAGLGKRIKTLTHVGKDVPREVALPLLMARIMTRVKFLENGCWEYTDHVDSSGYANAGLQGKTRRLNIFMYDACAGKMPDPGLDVCHSCHNRRCINPWHLRQDTHAANLQESAAAGRLGLKLKTVCKRGHPMVEGNLLRGKLRLCAICSRGRYRLRRGWPADLAFSVPLGPKGYLPPEVAALKLRRE